MMAVTTSQYIANLKTKRSGIIPFTNLDGKVYFLVGIDSKTSEYTDFGGGVKKYETALTAGIREFYQESRGIFSKEYYNLHNTLGNISIYSNTMTITFIPIQTKDMDSVKTFSTSKHTDKELSGVNWIEESSFRQMLNERRKGKGYMWLKVRNFLRNNINEELWFHFRQMRT